MTADAVALLAAVRADPDADLPRLVFADWCDDHGEPERAEYIRLSVEDARLSDDSPRRRELAFRCRELLDTHLDAWGGGAADRGGFERGFVAVAASDGDPGTLADAFAHPVRRLWVQPLGDNFSLRGVPADNRLTALDLTGNKLSAADLRGLARGRRLPHLDTLVLSLNLLDDEAAAVLCGEGFFQRLTHLQLGGNPFSDAGRQRLRDHFGDRVSFACERHPGHMYALQDDYLTTGFGGEHTQVLMTAGRDEVTAVCFDHAGRFLDVLTRPCLPSAGRPSWEVAKSAGDELAAEFGGLEPATVRVRRFAAGGLRIADYPDTMIEDWDAEEAADSTWDEVAVRRWLADGQWVFDFGGDDYWVNGDGEVTDT